MDIFDDVDDGLDVPEVAYEKADKLSFGDLFFDDDEIGELNFVFY